MRTDSDLANWDEGNLSGNVFVHSEGGKTEFSGWINTDPGKSSIVTLTYILPFRADAAYSLLLQKQSGSLPFEFIGSINLGNKRTTWVGDSINDGNSFATYRSNANTDDFWPLIFE
jgi:hypothetical protein